MKAISLPALLPTPPNLHDPLGTETLDVGGRLRLARGSVASSRTQESSSTVIEDADHNTSRTTQRRGHWEASASNT